MIAPKLAAGPSANDSPVLAIAIVLGAIAMLYPLVVLGAGPRAYLPTVRG